MISMNKGWTQQFYNTPVYLGKNLDTDKPASELCWNIDLTHL